MRRQGAVAAHDDKARRERGDGRSVDSPICSARNVVTPDRVDQAWRWTRSASISDSCGSAPCCWSQRHSIAQRASQN